MLRLAGRVAFGTAKFGVKHILIPIVISAATAAVATALSEKIREQTPKPLIVPEP
jgi:hypothetical protein